MINYLHHFAIPFTVIATKSDKIGKTRVFDRVGEISKYFSISRDSVIAVSSETKYNKDKLLDKIERVINIFNDDFFNQDEEE